MTELFQYNGKRKFGHTPNEEGEPGGNEIGVEKVRTGVDRVKINLKSTIKSTVVTMDLKVSDLIYRVKREGTVVHK